MKKNQLRTCAAALVAAIFIISGFRTAPLPGGESYKVYLNNKLVMDQFSDHKQLMLGKENRNDKIMITYNHCGIAGKKRTLTVKDETGKELKQYRFNDAGLSDRMVIQVSDLWSLKKSNPKSGSLSILYSSEQLPAGRLLTKVEVREVNLAHTSNKLTPLQPIFLK